MSIHQIERYRVTCDWGDCRKTLENLTEDDVEELETRGWEVDGSIFNGALTYCRTHAEQEG